MLIAPDTFQPNRSCRQYFISYLEGLLIDIYFCTETKSVVQHHIIKGNQPPLGSFFCLPLKKKVPSNLFHRYAFWMTLIHWLPIVYHLIMCMREILSDIYMSFIVSLSVQLSEFHWEFAKGLLRLMLTVHSFCSRETQWRVKKVLNHTVVKLNTEQSAL